MAATYDYAFPVGDPSLGAAAVMPGYSVAASQLGTHVVQDATIVCPTTGYPPCPAPGQPVVAGLGIINESDAWLTGRPYGLPGTATMQYVQQPDGSYASRMLGDLPNDFEASGDLRYVPYRQGWYVGYPQSQLGMYVNEVQRSVGSRYAQLGEGLLPVRDVLDRKGSTAMLAAIGSVLAVGLVGVIASRGR